MSLEFDQYWKVEDPYYVRRYGHYQNDLNMISETDVRQALKIASLLYHEGAIGDMIRAAINTGGQRVIVEQGAHQWEGKKDRGAKQSVKNFDSDLTRNWTVHFTLRHYGNGGYRKAFHCYLARNTRGEWSITSVSYMQNGAGLRMGQTGGRDFMAQLAKNFVMAHGYDDD